jgi:hypothetical protein
MKSKARTAVFIERDATASFGIGEFAIVKLCGCETAWHSERSQLDF